MNDDAAQLRQLSQEAASDLKSVAAQLTREYGDGTDPALIEEAPAAAEMLPDELHLRCRAPHPDLGMFVLRGLEVDDEAVGATPDHWSKETSRSAGWNVLMLLLASVMGRPFGWEGQQDGRLVHNILPTPGQEEEQTGASSSVLLSPHNEDAFHPQRANLVLLGCLRNHDAIPTHAASVRKTTMDEGDREVLTRPTLPILPDDSYDEAQQFGARPPKVPTLWRRGDGICVRFDPAYTPVADADERYQKAYQRFTDELERVTDQVVLEPGDVLVLDNDAVVHGRAPFQARYDGTDRWLKRTNVRVPENNRPTAEFDEHGYGQRIINPYG